MTRLQTIERLMSRMNPDDRALAEFFVAVTDTLETLTDRISKLDERVRALEASLR